MTTEKHLTPFSGFTILIIQIALVIAAVLLFLKGIVIPVPFAALAVILLSPGYIINNPNEAKVLTFFGKYIGTAKGNGFLWVNPFAVKKSVTLRMRNLNGNVLKVNDKLGNPIEIAAVIVWQVHDTAKAIFEVDDYNKYVAIQSEAAVRHLAGSCPYDTNENTETVMSLRGGGEKVHDLLKKELNERLAQAGILVDEARISHLAYAPEIAGAMLQKQQAIAVVAARQQIVEGAVGMVEMALNKLAERNVITLNDNQKGILVSNLLVVLCGDKNVTPTVNTGSANP